MSQVSSSSSASFSPTFSSSSSSSINNNVLPWIVILPRRPPQGKLYGRANGQEIYRAKIVEATMDMASMILNKKPSFAELIDRAATYRCKIAAEMETPMADKFGKLRTDPQMHRVTTPLKDGYADVWDGVSLFPQDDSGIEWDMYSSKDEDGVCMGVLIGTTHSGKKIKLSKFSFTWEKGHNFNSITHASPAVFSVILEECEYLYNELNKLSPRDFQENIAKIHWWSVQATFWFRGSAAIMEMTAAALMLAYKQELHPWRENVFPDLLALGSHLDVFVKLYPSLRESQRSSSSSFSEDDFKAKY